MKRYVIDTSVAVKWFFTDEVHVQKAHGVLRALVATPGSFLVPDLFYLELAAVCARKSGFDIAFGNNCISKIQALGLHTVPTISGLLKEALTLSCELKHALYDCIFLQLARSTDAKWLTADDRALKKLGGQIRYAILLEDF